MLTRSGRALPLLHWGERNVQDIASTRAFDVQTSERAPPIRRCNGPTFGPMRRRTLSTSYKPPQEEALSGTTARAECVEQVCLCNPRYRECRSAHYSHAHRRPGSVDGARCPYSPRRMRSLHPAEPSVLQSSPRSEHLARGEAHHAQHQDRANASQVLPVAGHALVFGRANFAMPKSRLSKTRKVQEPRQHRAEEVRLGQ